MKEFMKLKRMPLDVFSEILEFLFALGSVGTFLCRDIMEGIMCCQYGKISLGNKIPMRSRDV